MDKRKTVSNNDPRHTINDKDILNIGEWIHDLRLSRGLSQYSFGKKLNVSGGTVSTWEVGRIEPSIYHIAKICRIFNETYTIGNPELITKRVKYAKIIDEIENLLIKNKRGFY